VIFEFKNGISCKYLEKIVIKEHLKCLGVEPSHEIDGDVFSFNVVDCSTDSKHFLLSVCLKHLL
jgi:hypothetical protein